jgi:hypothetical protein
LIVLNVAALLVAAGILGFGSFDSPGVESSQTGFGPLL